MSDTNKHEHDNTHSNNNQNNDHPRPFEPTAWGPSYWHFLHSIAYTYPLEAPDELTKKQFYTFYQNLHRFLPDRQAADLFSKLLHTYPVTAYMDSQLSLVRWTHFIHNKVNERLEKPRMSMAAFEENYRLLNVSPAVHTHRYLVWKNNLILTIGVAVLVLVAVYLAFKTDVVIN